MQKWAILLTGLSVVTLCAVLVFGQTETRRDPPAPADKAVAWSAAEMTAAAKELAATKGTTHRYFGEKNYNMEVRRLTGPQPILLHAKKSDFMVIQDGEGTYVSGGELVNGKPGGEDAGDMRGDSIRGGVSQVVKPGDVIYVPAGIPHGFVETRDHVTFVMLRFDSK
jgi:uncharacterized cupin superfamily protein